MPNAPVPTGGFAFDGLEVIDELGRGSENIVYRARRGDREYALKVQRDIATADADATRAFRREAAILSQLRHPGLAQIHAVGERDGRPYLVMELVLGRTLGAMLADAPQPMGERRVVSLARDCAGALAAAHRAGLVHRDVKPDNIILNEDGRAKLIDFGLATQTGVRQRQDVAVGTLLYSPPEQTGMLKRPVDGRSDLYALGVVLFEAIAGVPPFRARDAGELVRLHAVAPPPDLREVAPGTSPALAGIVARLLAKDPDDRYQTGEGLLADLDRLAAHEGETPADFPLGLEDDPAALEYDLPLVGRREELAELRGAWERTRQGKGAVALVEGPPGGGKSRLVRELLTEARRDGALVLTGKVVRDNPVPLASLRDALEAHLTRISRLPAEVRDQAEAPVRAAALTAAGMAAAFSPQLGQLVGETVDHGHGDGQRSEQFLAAVAAFLTGLAREHGRMVLWIDDVQWLDDASRRVLELAALDIGDAPLLFVSTSRDDDESAAALEEFARVLGDTVTTRMVLGPLDEAGTAELVAEQIGGTLSDERFAAQIHTRSGGNPLAAVEYVRAVLHAGLIRPSWGVVEVDRDGLEDVALPEDVMGLVLARVTELGSDARWLLTAGAAMGTRFRPGMLTDVLGYDESRIASAVSDALRERLIERVDGEVCAYVHDRIREALLSRLSDDERRGLHQRLAEVLEAEGGDDDDHVYAVAWHYALGVPGRSPRKIYDWNLRAGRTALAGHASAEASHFFARAEEAAAAIGLDPDADYWETAGSIQLSLGDIDRAEEAFGRALDRSSDALQVARIHRLLAVARNAIYDSKGATEHAERGLKALGRRLPRTGVPGFFGAVRDALICLWLVLRGTKAEAAPADRERISVDVGLYQEAEYAAYMEMRSLRMLQIVMRTFSRALRLGSSHELSHTLVNVSVVAATFGSRRMQQKLLRRGMAMAYETGDPQAIAHAHLFEFLSTDVIGDTREAGEMAQRLLPEHGRWLDLRDLLIGVAGIAFNLTTRGEYRAARDAWMPVHDRMRNVKAAGVEENPYLLMGVLILEAMGARGEAAELFEACRRHDAQADEDNRFLHMFFLATSFRYEQEQGNLEARLDQLIDRSNDLGLHPLTASLWASPMFLYPSMGLAERARRAGEDRREEDVREARRQLKKVRRAKFHPIIDGMRVATDAEITRLEGRADRALALAAKAEQSAIACGAASLHFEVARIRARAYTDLDEAAEARRQALIAARLAADGGMAAWSREVADEFGIGMSAAGTSHASTRSGSVSSTHHASPGASRYETTAGTRHGGASLQGRRSLDALLALSLAAAHTREQSELVDVALDELVKLLGAERAFLFLADEDGQLTLEGARGADGGAPEHASTYAHTIVRRVHAEHRALVVTGTEEGAALGSDSAVQHGLRSILAAPLTIEGRQLGVVYLDSRLARGIFTDDDVEILGAISSHIAVSLETARTAQLEQAVAAEREQRGLAETLRDSMAVISAKLDPAEVVTSTLEMAGRSIAFDRAAVLLRDRRSWTVAAVAGDLDDALVGIYDGDPVDETLTPDGEGRVISDVGGAAAPLPTLLGDARSWLSVPLRARGELAGVLVMATDAADGLGVAQLELAATFAGQGVVAYENARLFEAVEQMATTDELTQVNNRRHFFELGEKQFATARRYGPPMSALMLDIDHFKQVNDRYGHAAGDDVIRAVAARLQGVIRTMDIIGRYGGEEFALVLPETGETATVLGERLRTAIEDAPISTCEGEISVTISVGHALMDASDKELADTLNRADAALYEAKRQGRNRVVSAPPPAPVRHIEAA